MNTEMIKEVSEIVKTINIGFDGKLNSETLVSIAEKVMPYFYMLQLKSMIVHILWAVAVVISAWLIGKAIIKCKD